MQPRQLIPRRFDRDRSGAPRPVYWLFGLAVIITSCLLSAVPREAALAAPLQTGSTWPGAETGLYVTTLDATTMVNWACAAVHQNASGWNSAGVLLDFGQPWNDNGVPSVRLHDGAATIKSLSQVEAASETFISNFLGCGAVGHTAFILGTSNFQGGSTAIGASHGAAWAGMAENVNSWMAVQGYDTRSYYAVGGSDIEPGWSDPASARAWVDGYSSVTTGPSLYNYGSCDGCPSADTTGCYYDSTTHRFCTIANQSIANGWTVNDVWYVSFGTSSAWAFPEIYFSPAASPPGNAQQWEYIDLYGNATSGGGGFYLNGALTQCVAAAQNPDPTAPATYSARNGWSAMVAELNNPNFAPFSAQSDPSWSTDIAWLQGSATSLPIGTCYS